MLPFFSYYILPTQTIVRNNIHIGHVKEDIEALLLALSPILYIFHRDIPKPHVLHPNIIQNLVIKPGTLDLLPLLGWFQNETGEYCFLNTEEQEESVRRQEAAKEFRKFYNELATAKDRPCAPTEHFLNILIPVPFATYSLLPAQRLVKNNVRIGHVKEDIETLLRPLILLLHISQPEVPKPPFLDYWIIQKLALKPGILELLQLFGYITTKRKECIWVEANSAEEMTQRVNIATEFRRFYEELKKSKDDPVVIFEYFISHVDSELSSRTYF